MPELSRFFGIVIAMYHRDHLPPHFHARYGGRKAVVSIETLEVLHGRLPPRVLSLVIEWGLSHQVELVDNWRRARKLDSLYPIPPLE